MNFEKRSNIKFCYKLGKSFSQTLQMMQEAYGEHSISRSTTYLWYDAFKNGRENIFDEHRSGRSKSAITDSSIVKVRDFIKNNRKVSLRYAEMELQVPKTTIHRILTVELGMRKLNSVFVPHNLKENQKQIRVQYAKEIIRSAQNDKNFLYSIVTGDETWFFAYEPETKRQSAEWRLPEEGNPKKCRLQKSKVKTMFICFYDSRGIIHKEFVRPGQTVTGAFYKTVLKRLLARIRRIRPEYRDKAKLRLVHDNAPAHRSSVITDYLDQNGIVTLKHSPYSPDLAGCDYFLFPKIHLALKGKYFDDIKEIQKATTNILRRISKDDFRKSFDSLLERANRCVDAEGDYFE